MLPTDDIQPQPTDTPTDMPVDEKPVKGADAETKKRWAEFRQRIDTTKSYRKKLLRNWTTNIDMRRGKAFASQTDDDAVAVNLDWSYTKTKQAALFSQVPKVRVAHAPESLVAGPWVATYERRLNDTLVKAGIEAALDEVMPDVINAAGVGIVLVAYEALTENKEVPAIDLSIFPPEVQMQALKTGMLFGEEIPMESVPQQVDARYTVRRISPADFLWPTDFTGSDFDNAPWLGYSGRMPWAEAASRFGLTDEDKEKVLTEDRSALDRLTNDVDKGTTYADDKVGYDELFYHEYQYDSNSKSFNTIHHLVFLHGKVDPVVDEPWKGQKLENGKVLGAQKKPLRVLTLTYLSDEDIPPSDSAVGRPQVLELNRGRTHVNRQRSRSAPWTWFDVNRLDPAIQGALMRGTWQHAIPVQGDGSRVLGTVEQPALHPENYKFDEIAKMDLQEIWTIGSNQMGSGGGVETKGEAGYIESNFQTKVGRERSRVASFFVGIAEVLGSLMCLYEDPTLFGDGFDQTLAEKLAYSILADSTVLVDSQQRLDRLNGFLNTYAKSGWVNIEPVLKEIATLIGLDPNTVIQPPQPTPPAEPNISLRLTGGQDMMNPLLLAFMIKAGQAPEPELVEKAKALIQAAVQMQGEIPPAPQPPVSPDGLPPAPATPLGEANPDMGLLPAVGKRAEDGPQGSSATGGGQY
jgi:hypothetical protein